MQPQLQGKSAVDWDREFSKAAAAADLKGKGRIVEVTDELADAMAKADLADKEERESKGKEKEISESAQMERFDTCSIHTVTIYINYIALQIMEQARRQRPRSHREDDCRMGGALSAAPPVRKR